MWCRHDGSSFRTRVAVLAADAVGRRCQHNSTTNPQSPHRTGSEACCHPSSDKSTLRVADRVDPQHLIVQLKLLAARAWRRPQRVHETWRGHNVAQGKRLSWAGMRGGRLASVSRSPRLDDSTESTPLPASSGEPRENQVLQWNLLKHHPSRGQNRARRIGEPGDLTLGSIKCGAERYCCARLQPSEVLRYPVCLAPHRHVVQIANSNRRLRRCRGRSWTQGEVETVERVYPPAAPPPVTGSGKLPRNLGDRCPRCTTPTRMGSNSGMWRSLPSASGSMTKSPPQGVEVSS